MRLAAEHETDVLIVGAGPTGLTLACELLGRGVSCRIVDKAASPATTSRALGLQPRTLELFDRMGIIDRVISTGGPVIDANLYRGDRLLLTLSAAGLRNLDTPYPRLWITPQASVEGPLIERLQELGGTVERSRELEDFRQTGSGVIATVKHGDAYETEEIHANWLVGCDGARSRVRKTLGVSFEGDTYEQRFLLADADVDWGRERDRTHTWFPPDGMFTVFPLPGTPQWRIFAVLEDEAVPPLSLELFQRLFRERTGDAKTTLSNPTWMSDFTINRRMVDRYRVERAFLAGDAAHVHSPFGAQGMNTGIQDACNLGWKLALVVRGKAPDRLLDTYEEERLPVARRVLAQTDTNTRMLLSDNPVMRFVRERVLTLESVQAYAARRSSQLFVNYRSSSLSRSHVGARIAESTGMAIPWARASGRAGLKDLLRFRGGPRAGDRAPGGPSIRAASRVKTSLFREFRGTGFSLLLFGGTVRTETGYANLLEIARRVEGLPGIPVKTHLIVGADVAPEDLAWEGSVLLDGSGSLHELYGARAESLYLVRPDGYVGFRGQPAEAEPLLEYLRSNYTNVSNGRLPLADKDPGKPASGIPARSRTRRRAEARAGERDESPRPHNASRRSMVMNARAGGKRMKGDPNMNHPNANQEAGETARQGARLQKLTEKAGYVQHTTCCIVGGGPAGAMLGLLLARKGVDVVVLEKHGDFLRDFRGDTIHPSTMELMDELGLAEKLLRLKHTKAPRLRFRTPQGSVTIADFGRLKTRFPYVAFMPQWDFLDFVTSEAASYPNFRLQMNAEVKELLEEDGEIRGVRYEAPDGAHEVRAALTVAADGRHSRVREQSGLRVIEAGPPIDVLWFRISRRQADPEESSGYIGGSKFLVFINRGDYWQVGYVIPKGADRRVREAGLEAFRRSIGEAVPLVADRTGELEDWEQVKLLSVQVNRLRRWYRPGLLCIGDAAHAMSPVGGVGINLAIQDAVAAANALAGPLLEGSVGVRHLRAVQRRREIPVRVIQGLQTLAHRRLAAPAVSSGGLPSPPAPVRALLGLRAVRDLPARIMAFGLWPVHVDR